MCCFSQQYLLRFKKRRVSAFLHKSGNCSLLKNASFHGCCDSPPQENIKLMNKRTRTQVIMQWIILANKMYCLRGCKWNELQKINGNNPDFLSIFLSSLIHKAHLRIKKAG